MDDSIQDGDGKKRPRHSARNLRKGVNSDGKEDTNTSGGLTLDDVSRQEVDKLLGRVGNRRGSVKKFQVQQGDSGKRGTKRKLEVFGDDPRFRPTSLSTSNCRTLAKTHLDEEIIQSHNQSMSEEGILTMGKSGQRNGSNMVSEGPMCTQDMTDVNEAPDSGEVGAHEEDDEFDWEEGVFSHTKGDHEQDTEKEWNGEVTLEVEGSAGKGSGTQQKPPQRRATAKDKEFAEIVHKAHLLCMLARGRIVDTACDDPLLQASILSLQPPSLGLSVVAEGASTKVLAPLVSWFKTSFRVLSAGEGSSSSSQELTQEGFHRRLLQSAQKQVGSAEEIAALSVAFLRCLGFTTRYVMVLDVAPLKPDADSLEASEDWESCLHEDGMKFAVDGDLETSRVASLAQILARSAPQLNGTHNRNVFVNDEKSSLLTGGRSQEVGGGGRGRGRGRGGRSRSGQGQGQTITILGKSAEVGEEVLLDCREPELEATGQKRIGDDEYEKHLAMAIAATSAAAESRQLGEEKISRVENGAVSLQPLPSAKKFMGTKGLGNSGKNSLRQKLGLFPKQDRVGSSGAGWSRKMGPLIYWAEVYCIEEGTGGRWVHVDAVRGIVDGVDKVGVAAAVCRLPLSYVVAFAGNGAKDVTRRYVTSWSTISPLRVDEDWWDHTLFPLKQLEATATAGASLRSTPGKANPSLPSKALYQKDLVAKDRMALSSELNRPSINEGVPIQSRRQPELKATIPEADNPQRAAHVDPKILPVSKLSVHYGSDRSALEDMEMEMKTFTEPLPTNQQAYKSHHLYAIEKWLTKYQTLHPRGPVLGYCAGHAVYPRTCVQILHTPDRWLREGFEVRADELPAKVIKSSRFAGKEVNSATINLDGKEESDPSGTTALYGKWQTQAWRPPTAVNGIVPKNERGQVDALSEKCIPPGTVHLRFPRLVPIVKELKIDFAPAMVGFEVRKGRSFPVYEGIVICEEYKDVILDAYQHQEDLRFVELRKKREEHAAKRWRLLLHSMATRQRLQAAYEHNPSVSMEKTLTSGKDVPVAKLFRSVADIMQTSERRPSIPRGKEVQESRESCESHQVHNFPEENQSFSEETGIRTKQCSCGFTIYVEEM